MTAYLDTSVLLRLVLREPGALDDLRSYDALVSSEQIAVESARTIDRLRVHGALTVEEAAGRLRAVTEWLEAIDLVLLRPPVLSRARRADADHPRHAGRHPLGDGADLARANGGVTNAGDT